MESVRTLLLLVVLAVAIAGCTSNTGGNGKTDATTPTSGQLTAAGGKALLENAAQHVPDRFGFSASILQGSNQVMTVNTSYVNSSGIAFLDIKADPASLAAMERGMSFGGNGFSVYHSPKGTVLTVNGTSFVFPADNSSSSSSSSMVTSQIKNNPFGSFLDPQEAVGTLTGANITVTNVEATTCRGQPALRITFSSTESGQPTTATADVLNTSPARLCHLETTLPKSTGQSSGADPMSGAIVKGDFYYDNDVPAIPDSATRPLGLLYKGPSPFGGSGDGPVVWTFLNSGGIPLSEVQVEVKNQTDSGSGMGGMAGGANVASEPTLWTMKLGDKTHTEGDITITFDDKDADGKVSQGDTLTITQPSDASTRVVLKDLKTNTYVVPGPGMFVVLGLVGLAALALRRK